MKILDLYSSIYCKICEVATIKTISYIPPEYNLATLNLEVDGVIISCIISDKDTPATSFQKILMQINKIHKNNMYITI